MRMKIPSLGAAGFIVIKNGKTILVEDHKGNLSFPKGKIEKGETKLDTALREVREETGIGLDQLIFIENGWLDEFSPKSTVNIRYFIAILKNPIEKFTYNECELKKVRWYTYKELNNSNLSDSRKRVFYRAIKKLNVNRCQT